MGIHDGGVNPGEQKMCSFFVQGLLRLGSMGIKRIFSRGKSGKIWFYPFKT